MVWHFSVRDRTKRSAWRGGLIIHRITDMLSTEEGTLQRCERRADR
jgi:hypothetical protein